MKTRYKWIYLILFVQLAGCGTYASMQKYATPHADGIVMGGIRTDIDMASGRRADPWLKKQPLYNPYVDMPFSAMADVVLLPFTLSYSIVDCVLFARCLGARNY